MRVFGMNRDVLLTFVFGLAWGVGCSNRDPKLETLEDVGVEVVDESEDIAFGDVLDEAVFDLNENLWEEEEALEGAAIAASEAILENSRADGQLFKVAASNLNVRKGPGLKFRTIDKVNEGAFVNVTEIKDKWAKVGKEKWVALRYLSLVTP